LKPPDECIARTEIEEFDIVITDIVNLDKKSRSSQNDNNHDSCLPEVETDKPSEHIRA
jgi:hypothetical protein